METPGFDLLTPKVVMTAVESAFGLHLDGTLTAYPSYVNRVYGLRSDEERGYVVKFYRPGRWNLEAIAEEHDFIIDCAERELPVVAPLRDDEGFTLQSVTAAGRVAEQDFTFSLYPQRSGRSFDAERDEDWFRIGSLVGRIHTVARMRDASNRLQCTPPGSTVRFIEELRGADDLHPAQRAEFFELTDNALSSFGHLFEGLLLHRIHGDCHRGNILDRPGEGLLIIDFDDMMMGPAVQDLWLLLPDRASACRREMELLLEGYEGVCSFDRRTLSLIEPLRFMRMIYYLAWSARQRNDHRFRESFPMWGTEAFWIKEIEDLRTQLEIIFEELDGET